MASAQAMFAALAVAALLNAADAARGSKGGQEPQDWGSSDQNLAARCGTRLDKWNFVRRDAMMARASLRPVARYAGQIRGELLLAQQFDGGPSIFKVTLDYDNATMLGTFLLVVSADKTCGPVLLRPSAEEADLPVFNPLGQEKGEPSSCTSRAGDLVKFNLFRALDHAETAQLDVYIGLKGTLSVLNLTAVLVNVLADDYSPVVACGVIRREANGTELAFDYNRRRWRYVSVDFDPSVYDPMTPATDPRFSAILPVTWAGLAILALVWLYLILVPVAVRFLHPSTFDSRYWPVQQAHRRVMRERLVRELRASEALRAERGGGKGNGRFWMDPLIIYLLEGKTQ